jgi:hypothetical protein
MRSPTRIGRKGFYLIIIAAAAAQMGCVARPHAPATQPAAPPYSGAMTFDVAEPRDYVSHQSSDGRLTLQAPPGWKEVAGGHGSIILKLVGEDQLTNVSVIEKGEPETHDIEALANMSCRQLAGEIPNFALQNTEYIRVSGIDSARLNFTGDSGGRPYHWQQVTILASTHAYIFTFTSPADRYESHLATADRLLASVNITE